MSFDTPQQPRIRLYSRELLYVQDSDTWDSKSDQQELRIVTHDCGDGTNYITIKTDRWAIDRDEIQQFADMLLKAMEGLE